MFTGSRLFLFLAAHSTPRLPIRRKFFCTGARQIPIYERKSKGVYFRMKGALVVLALNQLGSAFIQYGWDACYLCALEGMPTPVRSSSLGSCSLVAQFGALLAPVVSGFAFACCLFTQFARFVVLPQGGGAKGGGRTQL